MTGKWVAVCPSDCGCVFWMFSLHRDLDGGSPAPAVCIIAIKYANIASDQRLGGGSRGVGQ